MKHSLILCVATFAGATCANAQSNTNATLDETSDLVPEAERVLPQITVAGLRPVAEEDTTASLTVLDVEALVVRSAPFLADQLRSVPGVGVSRSGGSGGLTQLRFRGAEANHTLVLINGIEVSDPTTGETDFGLIAGLNPSRVEVLRGEQSGLYGSDAIGGVINIITDTAVAPSAFVEAGSFNTFRGDATYGLEHANGSIGFALAGYTTDGIDTSGNDGEKDGSEAISALLNADYNFTNGFELTGLARYAEGEADIDSDTDFDGLLNDVDRVGDYEQLTLGAQLQGVAFNLDHRLSASFNSVERENFSDGVFTNRSEGDRTKLSYSPSWQGGTDAGALTLTGLIDWEQEDYTARDDEFGGFTNQDERFETLGLASEARLDLGDFDLSASLRFDDNDGRFDDATTGRLGAAYTTQSVGRFRASFGTGVKNPTFTELFGFFPGSFIGNPDLVPEQSTSWEIGWDQRLGSLDFGITYFDAQLEDEIFTAFDANFNSTPQNREGESERSGVEVDLSWQATDALSLSGQATFIESSSDDGSDEIRVPAETASLSLDYRPDQWNGARIGLALDYVGTQDDFNFGAFPAERVELDAYVLTSVTAEIPIRGPVSLTLRGENVFDEEVVDVFGYENTGAGFFIGLKVRG